MITLSSYLCFLLFAAGWIGLPATARATIGAPRLQSQARTEEFVGSKRCVECHRDIASVQLSSDHARTLRRVEAIPELVKKVPLQFLDENNSVEYQIQKSTPLNGTFNLVALKDHRNEKLHLVWGFGTGRKGITFVGRNDAGDFGQSRVSWYQAKDKLDITPGLENRVRDSSDALADWLTPPKTERCFSCHVTRRPDIRPDQITDEIAGVQCERCHGPGRKHIEAVTEGSNPPGTAISNPGRLEAKELTRFCGACHGEPPEDFDLPAFSQIVSDKRSIRFPAKRLLLSRCYDESEGRLKCLTCHDPHEDLPKSLSYFDRKCQTCHAGKGSVRSTCPVAKKDCVSCHMPREQLMGHLDFVDHWIRKVEPK